MARYMKRRRVRIEQCDNIFARFSVHALSWDVEELSDETRETGSTS